jgi:hypothetical protein
MAKPVYPEGGISVMVQHCSMTVAYCFSEFTFTYASQGPEKLENRWIFLISEKFVSFSFISRIQNPKYKF